MKRAALCLFLCAVMTLSLAAPAGAAMVEEDIPIAEDIAVTAYSAILTDMDTGQVLYEYDADELNYPASTTKIMTSLLVLKYGNTADTVTVTEEAFADISEQASTGGLNVGETMTVHRLLQIMLVISASEAANVAAEYLCGSREDFVAMMNREAELLGCTGTHFANCHGLPNPDHYTTARDMALISGAAMEYEEFREIVGSAVTTLEATNMTSEWTIVSTNGILPGSRYPEYNYDGAIGIKTGHTSVAGYCLVSAAERDGLRLLCVVMGTPSRTSSFQQTIELFDWGYENFEIINYGQIPLDAPEAPDMTAADDEPEELITPPPTPSPSPSPTPEPSLAPSPTPSPVETAARGPVNGPVIGFVALAGLLALGFFLWLLAALRKEE